jgi:hypothetical protein
MRLENVKDKGWMRLAAVTDPADHFNSAEPTGRPDDRHRRPASDGSSPE